MAINQFLRLKNVRPNVNMGDNQPPKLPKPPAAPTAPVMPSGWPKPPKKGSAFYGD